MASPIFLSKPASRFSIVAIIRGIQLAFLGGYRSLQNPDIFRSKYYQKMLRLLKITFALQLVIWAPLYALWIVLMFANVFLSNKINIAELISNIRHIQKNILNLNAFLITLTKYFAADLDEIFLESLRFIDTVYAKRHPGTERQYHDSIVKLAPLQQTEVDKTKKSGMFEAVKSTFHSSGDFKKFMNGYMKTVLFNVFVHVICYVPKLGPLVLDTMSFSDLNEKIGTLPAILIVVVLHLVPRKFYLLFLTFFWGSRNMVHDLLSPYFNRVKLTDNEKDQWIKSREGVLFGFGICYFWLINYFSWFSILIYGFAETASAYLITKISDPPPMNPSALFQWNSTQIVWNEDKQKQVLTRDFLETDEGFQAIPGSFIFYTPKTNHLE